MSFDPNEVPTRSNPTTSQIHSSSNRSVVVETLGVDLGEQVSARQDYEPNQPAPAEALSPRSLLVRPRSNDSELNHSESIMKVALSSFKDMSPCDSGSWISSIDDIDLAHDSTFWSTDSSNLSSSNNYGYYQEFASVGPKVVNYVSVPSMDAQPMPTHVASECARKPAPFLKNTSSIESQATNRKRKQDPTGKDAILQSIYENPNFIDDEPTEHDVFLGRGGKANTHVGNFCWLEEKAKLQPQYAGASKGNKKKISQLLVDTIHGKGGRFLQPVKFQDKPQIYRYIEVLDNNALLKKASQTLRETNSLDEAKRKKY